MGNSGSTGVQPADHAVSITLSPVGVRLCEDHPYEGDIILWLDLEATQKELVDAKFFPKNICHYTAAIPRSESLIGFRLWPGALAFCRTLIQFPDLTREYISRKRVVELGCGVGLAGIFCAAKMHASHVTLTDKAVLGAAVERSIADNLGSKIEFAPFDWGNFEDLKKFSTLSFDTVIATEVVYAEEQDPLINALGAVNATTYLIQYSVRSEADEGYWRDRILKDFEIKGKFDQRFLAFPPMMSQLRIGSRRSELARLQAQVVGKALGTTHFVFKEAPGDVNLKDPLWKMPEMGIFTSFLRKYLVSGEVDLVVHSWKDLPIEEDGLTSICATMEREDPRDLFLVSKAGLKEAYKTGTLVVLSSSPRRKHNLPSFLLKSIPPSEQGERITSVQFVDVRGNIQTRIGKMGSMERESPGHALIVAKAAIDRFLKNKSEFPQVAEFIRESLRESFWQVLPLSVNPTAAAQGALAVEMRTGDGEAVKKTINHLSTFACVSEERKILASLGGGCHQAIGCTVLDRPYGRVKFLRGVGSNGVETRVAEIDSNHKNGILRKVDTVDKIAQIGGPSGIQLFERVHCDDHSELVEKEISENECLGVFVAKADAVTEKVCPILVSSKIPVWTSGVASWHALAQKGVWVNGTSDGLGETEPKQVDLLLNEENFKWLKLTHADAALGDTASIGTYQLKLKSGLTADSMLLKDKTHYYFSSGSGFSVLTSIVPGLVEKFRSGEFVVGCGPGRTADLIRRALEGSDTDLLVSYNFEDFKRKVVGR